MEVLRRKIHDVVAEEQPMTVRQVFYQLVSRAVIPKTESQYKSTVCRLLADMRRSGEIPYSWIADNTRWMRKPKTYSSMSSMLELTQRTYRRAIWNDQPVYVEIWLEKEALAGVLIEVTREWDVPLMVCRGYPSLSFLHAAAMTIEDQDKPTYLYYFGDRDPSGLDIDRFVEKEIRELAPTADLRFRRVAVLPEQIAQWELPTRPTKKTDSRAKGFHGESIEVDAIRPSELRSLCRECITLHIDQEVYRSTLAVEKAEKETLLEMASSYEG